MRQLSFGLLDMGWHGQDPTAITDVKTLRLSNSHNTIVSRSRKRNE
jgi:peptidyl-dipeptidase Dcp